MRILAGILMIIGGLIGGSLWFGIIKWLLPDNLGLLGTLIRVSPFYLSITGGIFTFMRKHWRWALTGAICSLLFPFTGIPALVLLIKRKSEFE